MAKHLKWVADKMLASPNRQVRDFGLHIRTMPLLKVARDAVPAGAEDFTALVDLAFDEFKQGGLPLPFPNFTLELEGMLVKVMTKTVRHPSILLCVAFFSNVDGVRDLEVLPGGFVYAERDLRTVSWIGADGEFEPYITEETSNAFDYARAMLVSVLALIRMSYARVEVVDVSEENKRRARMNRPPIPEQRIVTLDIENAARITFRKGGTHASPVGHLRRSHIRRLQTGKIITVSASSVRGGPTHPAHYVIQ